MVDVTIVREPPRCRASSTPRSVVDGDTFDPRAGWPRCRWRAAPAWPSGTTATSGWSLHDVDAGPAPGPHDRRQALLRVAERRMRVVAPGRRRRLRAEVRGRAGRRCWCVAAARGCAGRSKWVEDRRREPARRLPGPRAALRRPRRRSTPTAASWPSRGHRVRRRRLLDAPVHLRRRAADGGDASCSAPTRSRPTAPGPARSPPTRRRRRPTAASRVRRSSWPWSG